MVWFWKSNSWKKLLTVFGHLINKGDVGIAKLITGSKETGRLLIEMHGLKPILRIGGPTATKLEDHSGVNRAGDEIRRQIWNWIGHTMRRDREEHCVTALEWRLMVDPKQHEGG